MDNTPVIETERLRLRRFTERDAEALSQLGQGDVHHALAERGRERARQQHGQHARHASASLLRVAHPTALPRPFPRCARRGAATDASSVAAEKAGPGSVPNTQRSGHTAEGLPFNHH